MSNKILIKHGENTPVKGQLDGYELGYSTKGSGRGIGLPIVKRIIDSNPRYDLETEVIDNYFVQRVMVDLDK